MSIAAHQYLANTWNRDKVMGVVQFMSMMLKGPVDGAGMYELSKSLASLGAMADSYRAITRLSLLFPAVAKETMQDIEANSEDQFVKRLAQLSQVFHVFYLVNEHTAVLAGHGVLPRPLTRFGGSAVMCWLSTLILGLVRQGYLLVKGQEGRPMSSKVQKRALVNLLKMACYAIFALTCLPKSRPLAVTDGTAVTSVVGSVLNTLKPKHLPLGDTARGALGLVASACEFY